MRHGLFLLPVFLLTGCAAEPEPVGPSAPAAPASPLAGAWVAEAFGGAIHERWEAADDGALLKAEGYFVADGDTSYSEVVRIGEVAGVTYLVAHPSTGGVMVWEQTAASPAGMTFENPTLEHPARIVYAFEGDGAFTRTLYGVQDGEEVVNELRFVRP
ncbi:MAG: DUF6265 family protein [Rubricoccaceae bacterium]|nr:DUF6265 family protein [Rubricoccaceae bacterium]